MSSYQFNHPPHNRSSRPTLYRPCGGVFPGLVSCWWLTGWWVDVADARLLLYPTCNSILYKNHIYIALCANDWSDEGFTVFVRGNGAGRGITTSTHTTKCHAAPSIHLPAGFRWYFTRQLLLLRRPPSSWNLLFHRTNMIVSWINYGLPHVLHPLEKFWLFSCLVNSAAEGLRDGREGSVIP